MSLCIPMVWPPSVVLPFTNSNICSETAWPFKAKFNVEPPRVEETIVCSQHMGHMTKMADTPIHGKKNFKNLLLNYWTDFNTMHVAFGHQLIIVCSNDDLGWP